MNLEDRDLLELQELCHALVDGLATAAQRQRLEEMLAGSEEARRCYVRTMALSASLFDYAAEMQSEEPDAPLLAEAALTDSSGLSRWTLAWGSLAAAATLMLAFWLGGWARTGDPAETAAVASANDESVARISGVKDCQWQSAPNQPGDELQRGEQLVLKSGFVEITFDCGAQITLEGPAALTLNSAWEAALERGTLKASVPPEAIGFRVSNAEVEVVDLGTEFSMVADGQSVTEVFVTKGAVEVRSREDLEETRPALILGENQARRFARNGGSDVRDRDQKLAGFSRKVAFERSLRPANYLHWSFDERGAETFAGKTFGTGSMAAEEMRLVGKPDAGPSNVHGEGRFAGALQLNGSAFAEVPIAGLGQRSARTVALWVKIPAGAPLRAAGAILSWPLNETKGGGVEIGWNRNPDFGALGALRTQFGRGMQVGSTPLRDDRWHHLAVVLTPGRKAESLQTRQYVDGRLEVVSAKRKGGRFHNSAGPEWMAASNDVLQIGRARNGACFYGELDELFVADAALSPMEIRQLMVRNYPSRAETLAAN